MTPTRMGGRTFRRLWAACDALRAGDENAAAYHLVELLQVSAVGISGEDGTLLTWDGVGNHHYGDLVDPIAAAFATGVVQLVNHELSPCPGRRPCGVRTAVVVPLLVEGRVKAVVTVCARSLSARRVREIRAVAEVLADHLGLEVLDECRTELAAAEVRAHRAQISPHFMYNALAAIASMIRTNPAHARTLLSEFTDFIDYSFRAHGQFGTLSDELGSIDHYLALEQARFGARLTVTLAIAPEVLAVVIPVLSLQPLVENAVHHGMDRASGTCHVTITAQDIGTEVMISVEDEGPGMDPAELTGGRGDGIALRNINDRLRRVYGDDYCLLVDTAPGAGTKVTMKVPKFRAGVHPPLPAYSRPKRSG